MIRSVTAIAISSPGDLVTGSDRDPECCYVRGPSPPNRKCWLAARSHHRNGCARSSCPCRKSNPNVLVMQTTKIRLCEDPTDVLNFACNRRVFVQRDMRAGLVLISHVGQ